MITPTFQEPSAVLPKVAAEAVEAPFGRKADGTPYQRDPKIYENRRPKGSGEPKEAAASPRRRSTPNKAPETPERALARAQAVLDLLSIPVAGLAMAGQARDDIALVADSIVIGAAAPKLAMAVADVAAQDPRVAALVDQLVQTGPWAALFTALVPMALQVAANHNDTVAKFAAPLGAVSAQTVVKQAVKTAEPYDE